MTRIKTINVSNNMFVFFFLFVEQQLDSSRQSRVREMRREGILEGKLCCNNRRYMVSKRPRGSNERAHLCICTQRLYRRLKSIFHRGIYLLFCFYFFSLLLLLAFIFTSLSLFSLSTSS